MDLDKIEGGFSKTNDGKCSTAAGGMVATAFPEATRAGVKMLEKGGNADRRRLRVRFRSRRL